jgi:rhodanese-related sulfurtransferase
MKNLATPEWKEAYKSSDNAIMLDVRTAEEFANGYIKDAILIDVQDPQNFTQKVSELDTSKDYYVYCRSGKRSLLACQVMQSMGFSKLTNLEGGILSWDEETVID